MAEKLQAVQEQAQNVYGKVYGTAHKTFLAGVGMMAWAQDEIVDLWVHGNEFADKLVVRGEEISKVRQAQINELIEKNQAQVKDAANKTTETFDKYSEQVLTRVNVKLPTVEDLDVLNKKVATLSRKLNKTAKEQQEVLIDLDAKVTNIDNKLNAVLEEKAVA
ncbi:MAG: phasin family protein [Anaerolineales bacterium]|nr:phasin family protein [Anaerolineales bacterium]